MRIAIIHDCIYPYRNGGGEVRNHYLARQLADNGHEVFLVGMKDWDGDDYLELSEGVTAVGVSTGMALYDQTGKRTISDAMMFAASCSSQQLDKYIPDVDLVEANNIPYMHLPNIHRWTDSKDIPMFVTWHEVYGYSHWRKERNLIVGAFATYYERKATKFGDYIIAVSDHTKQRLLDLGVKPEKIKVVFGGVDTTKIEQTPPDGPESDVIYSARLVSTKRVDLLLSASQISSEKLGRPIKGVITGDGPLKNELEELSDKKGLDFEFTGWLPEKEDVWGRMKNSKVMVHTSQREGFGFAALEAMACGLPVVAMNEATTAIGELVTEGRNGYITDPDPSSVSEGIIKALGNYQSMSASCRHQADSFSWERSGESLMKAYKV